MADAKPVNIGLIIIGIAVLFGIISLFYFDQNESLIIRTNNSTPSENITSNSETNQTDITTHKILILNNNFSPSIKTIKKGDTVIWTNNDNLPHSITSDTGTELGSGVLIKNESYSHKFQFDGTYNYHCNFNESIKGKIIVEI